MSGGFATSQGFANVISYGADGTQQWGTAELTKSASANVKSAWFSLGILTADCGAFLLRVFHLNNSGTETGSQFDIGIGPGGSQVVLIPNLNLSQPTPAGNTNLDTFNHVIPIALPQGTNVWVRAAVNLASSTPHLGGAITPMDSAFNSMQEFAGVEAIGSTAVGVGTALTGGAGSKGSYVELTSATVPTSKDYAGLFLCFDLAAQAGPIKCLVDIAIGGSGSQVVIIPNLVLAPVVAFSAMDVEVIPVEIPAGTRVWARSCNLDGSTQSIGVTAYGVF